MKEWLEPDRIWSMFTIRNKEGFLEQYFFKGRFHSKVPEDVIKNYETVEYLMIFSWYNYNIYDSAVLKLLLTLEIAVKQRAEQMGIPLTRTSKNKKSRTSKTLKELIDEVTGLPVNDERILILDNLRNVRNILAHPKNQSGMGALIRNKVIPTINVINELFSEKNRKAIDHNKVSEALDRLHGQTLVLEIGSKKFLINKAELLESCKIKKNTYLLFFEPVINDSQEYFMNHKRPSFLSVEWNNLKISLNLITGNDSGTSVKLYPSEKAENVNRHKQFLRNRDRAKRSVLITYNHFLQADKYDLVELFRYHHYWGEDKA